MALTRQRPCQPILARATRGTRDWFDGDRTNELRLDPRALRTANWTILSGSPEEIDNVTHAYESGSGIISTPVTMRHDAWITWPGSPNLDFAQEADFLVLGFDHRLGIDFQPVFEYLGVDAPEVEVERQVSLDQVVRGQ